MALLENLNFDKPTGKTHLYGVDWVDHEHQNTYTQYRFIRNGL